MVTPYNAESLASSIADDLSSSIGGKVVLTTGVSPGGLGAHFVETIAKHKPKLLILAGRSSSKIQATADKIASIAPEVGTKLLVLDLASQAQIRSAAQEVLSYAEPAIDVLVNNAGIMAGPYRTTVEGIELQFGSNHIGHYLFTNLIMPKLLASPAPRIVNVSSTGYYLGPVRFEDWNFEDGKKYKQWEAYGQSKAANILFTKSLATKLGGKGVKAYSLHPGVAGTNLAELGDPLGTGEGGFKFKTVDGCAATHVVAAFDPRMETYNGAYLEDGNVQTKIGSNASNPADAERLWELSEKLVGQKFEY
ncbi:hypothetical protein BDV96DRAFT_482071 [Lophiotrema nucula]|uniref:Short-chain dehydrogenase n=1 Tax=Lophiotrema nucula TaxID=690887 RepID=A0A6A5ZTB2_9PLEO|nr:hypothetical protein BDV96DRAFT_482071 [Lophiotrema nucula]